MMTKTYIYKNCFQVKANPLIMTKLVVGWIGYQISVVVDHVANSLFVIDNVKYLNCVGDGRDKY